MTAFATVDQAKADSTETTTTGTVTAATGTTTTDTTTTGTVTATTDNASTGTTEIITPENPKDGVETSKTVTRTINFVDGTGKTIAPSVTQTAHFTRNVTIDKVTGKELSATDWQSTDATFEAVTAPEVTGWTAPKEPVASETVTADTANQTETVKYTGQDMRYDFTFYDADDNNKVLYHWDVLASPLDPDISKKQAFIVDDLEAKGFEFEDAGYVEDVSRRSTVYPSAVVNGRTVTTNLSVWYFNHGTQVVTPENPKDGVETSKTVTRTISYVDANGKTIAQV